MKVYVNTSVFGGCFDVEFEEWSKLMEEFQLGLNPLIFLDNFICACYPVRK